MDSYTLAHRRVAPLLEAAREFDIATNPHPLALFEAGSGGLQIGCTPADNPGGLWKQLEMYAGAFSKPCALVASVGWQWSEGEEPTVTGLWLTTDAYELQRADRLPGDRCTTGWRISSGRSRSWNGSGRHRGRIVRCPLSW